jgi:hypothetical protein
VCRIMASGVTLRARNALPEARVLTKAQQVIMNFWVRDDVELLNILLDVKGL